MSSLASRSCKSCKGDVPALKGDALKKILAELGGGWAAVKEHHLEKDFKFKNFREALAFTNRVGEIAEKEGHHPDIHLGWGHAKIEIWTHKIDGLTESDFVLAAKAEAAAAQ